MYETRSKDLILRRVREALAKGSAPLPPTPDLSAPLHPPTGDLVEEFARNFIAAGGTFVYCEGDEQFFEELYRFKQQAKLATLHVWEPGLQEYLAHGHIEFTAGAEKFVADAPATSIWASGSIIAPMPCMMARQCGWSILCRAAFLTSVILSEAKDLPAKKHRRPAVACLFERPPTR